MNNRNVRRLGLLTSCIVLAVAACGGDDSDAADETTTVPAVETTAAPAETTTAAPEGTDAPPETDAPTVDLSGLPDTITLGVVDSLSGPAAFCGENEVSGMELAVELAEEQGLLDDTNIELQIVDDASTSEGGVTAYRQLVDAGVSAILGPCFSAAAQAVVPLADAEEIPIVLTTAGGSAFPDPEFVYRSGIPQTQFANLTADALAERGIESVGVIFQNDNEAIVDLWNSDMKPRMEELGIEILSEDGVAGTTTDFSPQIAKFADNPPDAIGILVVGGANVTIVTQVRENGIDLPLFGQLAMAAPFFLANAGAAADGTIFAVNFHPGFEFPSSQEFTEAYRAKYDKDPDYAAANGYDAALRTILAIRAGASAESTDVKAALDALTEMEGAQGALTFLENGDVTGDAGVVEVQGDKTVTIFLGGQS